MSDGPDGSRAPIGAVVLHRLLVHNAYATRLLLERCRELSAEQFHARFEMGPGSLHDVLRHVVGAMRRWAERIDDREPPASVEDDGPATPDALLAQLADAHADLTNVARRVADEGRLDEDMDVLIRGYERPFRFTRGSALVHVLTHGVHHRAQAANMMRRLGLDDIPELDALDAELADRPENDPRR